MATGRIGVTPTLGTRWSKAPTGGTTSLSGLDDNSVSLVYSVGYEQVYRNGVLLSRGNDYTATTGNSITLIDATIAGDIIEVFANELVPLTDAISKGQFTAKGALLSATAASTPGVLTVGSNDQVLTADSSTSTGLKWAAPAAGGMTLISTTTINNDASIILSSIPQTYKDLVVVVRNYKPASDGFPLVMRFNADSTANRHRSASTNTTTMLVATTFNNTSVQISAENDSAVATGLNHTTIYDYTNTATWKMSESLSIAVDETTTTSFRYYKVFGFYNQTSAISSLEFLQLGGNLTSGTILLYGVK